MTKGRHQRAAQKQEEVKVIQSYNEKTEIPDKAAMSGGSRWMLLGVCCLIVVWGSGEALEARLRGSVSLPCELQQRTCPIQHLLVYWQRKLDGKYILVAGVSNKSLTTNEQHEAYRGRASLNLTNLSNGDFTLHLSHLWSNDSGIYDCFIFCEETSTQKLLENTTELHVTANYSTPVITSSPPSERNPELKLTCTTQGGAPQPEITWINASDGTPIHKRHIHNDFDQVEDFINVTSTVTINVTSTTNFSCVILTASGNLTYVLEVTGENKETGKQYGVAPAVRNSIIMLVVLLIIAIVVVIMVLKKPFSFPTGCWRREYQQGKADSD
ncbi:ICOS ligand-like isoform X2 [Aquarana catesbeiana]|uniref:ICOS ligand-like isoform X2 n=1 Tax=Aquarana catesbeiana TaxID=8400 RepID=UPI003CCA3521